jgi:hypothetical protein
MNNWEDRWTELLLKEYESDLVEKFRSYKSFQDFVDAIYISASQEAEKSENKLAVIEKFIEAAQDAISTEISIRYNKNSV